MSEDRRRDLWRIRLALIGLTVLAAALLVGALLYARAVF